MTVLVNGKATSITQSLTAGTNAAGIEALFTASANYTTLFTAGVKVTDDGGKLKFTGTANQSIEVLRDDRDPSRDVVMHDQGERSEMLVGQGGLAVPVAPQHVAEVVLGQSSGAVGRAIAPARDVDERSASVDRAVFDPESGFAIRSRKVVVKAPTVSLEHRRALRPFRLRLKLPCCIEGALRSRRRQQA